MLNARMSSTSATTPDTAQDFWVHVQFRPAAARTAAFAQNLAKALSEPVILDGTTHEVPVRFTGASNDAASVNLTFAVSMGPEDQIPAFSAASLAGYGMLDRLFTQFSDFTPAYAGPPTEDEVEMATLIGQRLGFADAATLAA